MSHIAGMMLCFGIGISAFFKKINGYDMSYAASARREVLDHVGKATTF
jgi:hypothetical protein